MALCVLILLLFLAQQSLCLLPPKFQWKSIDFVWEANQSRATAISRKDYIPENNMPTGIARWKDKLFITIPRLKEGVPCSLNYVYLNGRQDQPLRPYPTWFDAFVPNAAGGAPSNSTVVCAFKPHVDSCDRLWVLDNGVSDITGRVKQITDPAIVIFDLNTNKLIYRHVLGDDVLKDTSIFTSLVVERVHGKKTDCSNAFAYITDMGSNAIVVFSLKERQAWRVENPYFHFDPHAGTYKVGGIDFYWSDGISSAALSKQQSNGYRDIYFHPTSSTKQFKMSTKLLRNRETPNEDIFNGVEIVGDKGPLSQSTACDFDPQNNVLFYTQLSKNGVGCWNIEKPFNGQNNPVILSDCNIMEFPSDIKVDRENNLWILSNRQSRFLYGTMDHNQVNFRVLTAPTAEMVKGTTCERKSALSRAFSLMKRPKSDSSRSSKASNVSSKASNVSSKASKKSSAQQKKEEQSKSKY